MLIVMVGLHPVHDEGELEAVRGRVHLGSVHELTVALRLVDGIEVSKW